MLMANYGHVRRRVLAAAREGRATLVPAGARHNGTALILIDGEEVGQASQYGHYVREDPDQKLPTIAGRKYNDFSERRLIPHYDHSLPREERAART